MSSPESHGAEATAGSGEIAWTLDSFFSSPEGPDFDAFVLGIEHDLAAFDGQCYVASSDLEHLERDLLALEDLEARLGHLWAYAYCVESASPSPATRRVHDAHIRLGGGVRSVESRISLRLKSLADPDFARLLARPRLIDVAVRLNRLRSSARKPFTTEQEELANDLVADGLHAWSRFAHDLFVRLQIKIEEGPHAGATIPFSKRYEYFFDDRPDIRHPAYRAYKIAIADRAEELRAALNGIAGFRCTIAGHQNETVLEQTARQMAIAPATVETMVDALHGGREILQRYLRLKAKALGQTRLEVPDRWTALGRTPFLAPRECIERIVEALQGSSPPIGADVAMMVENSWIDFRTNAGRPPLPFCVDSPINAESRVFLTTPGGLVSQTICAHELGHAYHFNRMRGLRAWRRQSPLPLMESASTTAEHLFRAGISQKGDAQDRLTVLAAGLDTAVNYLMRAPRDFEIEKAIYAVRIERELTVKDLDAICVDANSHWFSDTFAPDGDLYAWTTLLAFPSYTAFFNFPYTFGFGLSVRISNELLAGGVVQQDRYDRYLRMTGTFPVEECVRSTLDLDVGAASFWHDLLELLRRQVDEFAALVDARGAAPHGQRGGHAQTSRSQTKALQ